MIEPAARRASALSIQRPPIGGPRLHGFEPGPGTEPDLLSDDPAPKPMRPMTGAIADYEKSMLVPRLRGARARENARTGRCEGRKPYGRYPGEKRIVERRQALGDEGLGFGRNADALNREGIQPWRAETRWHGLVVNRILSRESHLALRH